MKKSQHLIGHRSLFADYTSIDWIVENLGRSVGGPNGERDGSTTVKPPRVPRTERSKHSCNFLEGSADAPTFTTINCQYPGILFVGRDSNCDLRISFTSRRTPVNWIGEKGELLDTFPQQSR